MKAVAVSSIFKKNTHKWVVWPPGPAPQQSTGKGGEKTLTEARKEKKKKKILSEAEAIQSLLLLWEL